MLASNGIIASLPHELAATNILYLQINLLLLVIVGVLVDDRLAYGVFYRLLVVALEVLEHETAQECTLATLLVTNERDLDLPCHVLQYAHLVHN